MKTSVVGIHKKNLTEVPLMGTHNVFKEKQEQVFIWLLLLSGAMAHDQGL